MKDKIIIIGNGIAAITATKSIREMDKKCEIHIFGEEKFYPYNRIRLSKGLLGTLEEDKILLQKKEWYDANNIDIHVNKRVNSIDTERKEVVISDGNKMNYSKLLLANGASDRIPPIIGIDKKGVLTLRTLKNAWDITDNIKDSNVVLNIGGGIQGLETAWNLSQLGKKVIIAEISNRLMPRQLDETASIILENMVKSQGIDIILNTSVKEITGEEKADGFITSNDKRFNCDTVIYSTGIKPNIEISKGTNIKTNFGVIVNNKMETNVKDIYAAGDIAELDKQIYGLWNIAIGHGKVAGYNIVGKDITYEHIVPVTTLNAFNHSLFSMGDIHENNITDIIIENESEKNSYKKVLIKDNKIIGAIVIGNIKSSPALKTAIEKETDLSNINFKNINFDEFIKIIKERNRKK